MVGALYFWNASRLARPEPDGDIKALSHRGVIHQTFSL